MKRDPKKLAEEVVKTFQELSNNPITEPQTLTPQQLFKAAQKITDTIESLEIEDSFIRYIVIEIALRAIDPSIKTNFEIVSSIDARSMSQV